MDMLKRALLTGGIGAAVIGSSAAAGLFGAAPDSVVGEWSYTTINGRSYYDRTNGSYLGHGGGNSETYTFAKDGTFKDFVYIERSPMAGWTTQITTTMEGRVEWTADSYKLIPVKGHYKVRDNRVQRQNYDRAMTPEDLQRMQKSYRYSTGVENGKPVLYIYMGDSKLAYKRAK